MNMGSSLGVPTQNFNFYWGRPRMDSDSEESSDDDSSSESEGEAPTAEYNSPPTSQHSTTPKCPTPDFVTVEQVQEFEQTLDLLETLSIIFLVFEDHSYALQTIKVLVAQGPIIFSKYYISDWVLKKGPSNVSKKLLEALAVVQNYRVLKDLGVTKTEAEERFLPSHDCTLFLNRVKKMLYLLVDSLASEQVRALVENVRNDGGELFKNDITARVDPKYIEFHLLFWNDRGYIKIDNEKICLEKLISVMTQSTKHVVPFELSPELKHRLNEVKKMVNNLTKEKIVELTVEDNIYHIKDEKNVGLVLIFNFDNFEKKEDRKEFLHLLPPYDLSNREGSELDAKMLHTIFTVSNFKVVTINNCCHFEIQNKIEATVKENYNPNHSMLFLCVLSHGSEGRVFAANSCPVRIRAIEKMISGTSPVGQMFANKPKAIIVQACQGTGRLTVEPEVEEFDVRGTDYELDSCEGACLDAQGDFTPEQADVLVCKAIIEGYAAIRHKKEGSFYIKELCRTIKHYRDREHFEDLILRVHASLNKKRIHVQLPDIERSSPCDKGHMDCAIMYMTPKKESTLRAKLYLTKQVYKS